MAKIKHGEWGMGNGEWGMGNGEWGVGSRESGVGNEPLICKQNFWTFGAIFLIQTYRTSHLPRVNSPQFSDAGCL